MNLDATKTVRELALEVPNATRIFEKLGIDYCCGGNKSLNEACSAARISPDEVLKSLAGAGQSTTREDAGKDWSKESLTALIQYIVQTHHAYTREEVSRILPLIQKVCNVHGQNHRELLDIQQHFFGLAEEISAHLMKEEEILFPYITELEEARQQQAAPVCMFGTVENPVRMMMFEHDNAGNALRQMRALSNGYTVPPDACVSYQTLYKALASLESDLHQHIHLENNILFPRTLEMERA